MTEPVAYIYNYANGDYALWHKTEQHIEKAIPLYTKEQLQPRVKMTQVEFDELEMWLINAQFDYSELKKTIEIVPDVKWFVRSKRASSFGNYIYLKKIESDDKVTAFNLKSVAEQFDTKEEAELWTNPLTEAVQLPVEGE